ncbi:acidic mammalian chitinase-like [Gigantopelta aegis]|uniref:acidic mammalian chitinase-like n=1 Tax=Gigantopelta aegis TaxID=1735272 RepID=UPI001B88B543|nr:acidic mammalian chitinase-like [Gigantopelta aegis]
MTAKLYNRLRALKVDNPHLKILLSLGGWNMGSQKFTKLVSSGDNMKAFATNAMKYLHDKGFDGLDIDWEFPTRRGSPDGDKQRFTELLRVLKHAFYQEHFVHRNKNLMLTVAVSANPGVVATYYEPSKISQYVDFFNVMTYDFHGGWENYTGHHSALDGPDSEPFTVKKSATAWANHGVPKSKIMIGIPFTAHTFTLKDGNHTGIGSPTIGAGRAGEITKQKGSLAYFEVCKLLQQGAEGHRLVDYHVPYLVDGDRWVGYDDEKSIEEKVQYVVNEGFGGIFVWALDLDDFSGVCGKQFPLMNKIKDTFAHLIG